MRAHLASYDAAVATTLDGTAWRGLNQIHHDLSDLVESALKRETGIPMSWYEILDVLDREAATVRVSEVGAQVTLSPSRVCRVLHSMEEEGLVLRLSSPEDARATDVEVSKKGAALCRHANEVIAEALASAGGGLSPADLKQLQRIWTKLGGPARDPSPTAPRNQPR